MTRFRRSGRNWEGRAWVTSPSLNALMDEIEAAYPERHAADGTVASQGHDAGNPRSDHRPFPYSGAGVVNAVDFGETVENDAFDICEAIRESRDARVRYVIHEARLFSSYPSGSIPPYTWRRYSGGNQHLNHGHVSVLRSNQSDGQPWGLGLGDTMPALQVEDLQQACNDANLKGADGDPLVVDGIYGPNTHHAFVEGLKGGGLTKSQGDNRYARKSHPHTIT